MASKSKKLSIAADIFEQNIEGAIRKIPLSDIVPSTDQPRQTKDANLEALAQSLKEEGLLQPIVVTREAGKFVIIAGERRYRAATMIGWSEIECRILHRDPREKYKLAVIENLQRENLDAFEEAQAYKKLKTEFNYTDSQLASIIGKSRNYINEILSIADIPLQWQLKAKEAGISSKNLLMQLAQAAKQNAAEEFINAYQQGTITTVKAAKSFIKDKKDKKEKPAKGDVTQGTAPTQVKVHLTWENETDIRIEGSISGLKNADFPLEHLESVLTAVIYKTLKQGK